MSDVTLWQGDCLDLMRDIPDASVDLIAADLPYGTTACKWDVVIPFEPLWAHYRRVLKPRGAVVLTASQPFTAQLVMSNPRWFKYCLVAERGQSSNFINSRFQPLKVHDDLVIFSPAAASYSRRGNMAYHPQMENRPGMRGGGSHIRRFPFQSALLPRKPRTEETSYPRSVLRFKRETGLHPTQKPVALFEYLIRTYSYPGDLVLDNSMGSGTTLVAAINTGRRCIGIEKDPGIFATAQARLAPLIVAAISA